MDSLFYTFYTGGFECVLTVSIIGLIFVAFTGG